MSELLMLVDEDTEAFNRIMDVFAMPKGTDAEKGRPLQSRFRRPRSTRRRCPLRTMKCIGEVFDIVK